MHRICPRLRRGKKLVNSRSSHGNAECRVPGFILHSSFFILHLGTPLPDRTPLLKRPSGNTLPVMKPNGMVYLVGAGPGDAGLLTLRGAELLRRAALVLYDPLLNSAFLGLPPNSPQIIYIR